MPRTPKADYLPLIEQAVRRRLLSGDDVTVAALATELGISPALVHFYGGSRQNLIAQGWRDILEAYISADQEQAATAAAIDEWDLVSQLIREVFGAERDGARRAHLRVAGEAVQGGLVGEVVSQETQKAIQSWREALDAAYELGVITNVLDTETLAMLLVGLPLGITALGVDFTEEQRDKIAHAWSTMLQAVLRPGFRLDAPDAT